MKTAILLMAHGSRIPEANQAVDQIAAMVKDFAGYDIVEVAFREQHLPNIQQGVDLCVAPRGETHPARALLPLPGRPRAGGPPGRAGAGQGAPPRGGDGPRQAPGRARQAWPRSWWNGWGGASAKRGGSDVGAPAPGRDRGGILSHHRGGGGTAPLVGKRVARRAPRHPYQCRFRLPRLDGDLSRCHRLRHRGTEGGMRHRHRHHHGERRHRQAAAGKLRRDPSPATSGRRRVAKDAKALAITRSILAMRKGVRDPNNRIFVIGNAPTALFELIRLIGEEGVAPGADSGAAGRLRRGGGEQAGTGGAGAKPAGTPLRHQRRPQGGLQRRRGGDERHPHSGGPPSNPPG